MSRNSGRRALFVIASDRAGGAERVAAILARTLAAREGWSVHFYVLCARCEPSFTEMMFAGTPVKVFYGLSERERGGVLPFLGFLTRSQYDFAFSTHAHVNAAMCLVRRFRKRMARRLVTRESTVLFDRFRGLRRLFYALCYQVYGVQDMIVAQTDYMASHLHRHLPARARSKVRVLPNPLDLKWIQELAAIPLSAEDLSLLSGRRNVVFCGRLIEVKQPDLAIRTFAELKARAAMDLRLVFVGEGPLRPELEDLARGLGLEEDVVFLGQRENPYQILSACDFGILTSSKEGFPNVVLEMMACGLKKVVTTNCAGDLDRLGNVSVVFDPTPDALARELHEAINGQQNHAESYSEVVRSRAVERYLHELL